MAFSGGKDSIVLLDLVRRALPKSAFIVVFGDTGMEFPDTYKVIDAVEAQCKAAGINFYRAASRLNTADSWKIFGLPSTVLRWCCSVHKAAPQTYKKYSLYFRVDEDYFPMINPDSIPELKWEATYAHKSFVEAISDLEKMLSRGSSIDKKGLWIEGAYGTGKSRLIWTLQNLLDCSPEKFKEYFNEYELLRKETDLRDKNSCRQSPQSCYGLSLRFGRNHFH